VHNEFQFALPEGDDRLEISIISSGVNVMYAFVFPVI